MDQFSPGAWVLLLTSLEFVGSRRLKRGAAATQDSLRNNRRRGPPLSFRGVPRNSLYRAAPSNLMLSTAFARRRQQGENMGGYEDEHAHHTDELFPRLPETSTLPSNIDRRSFLVRNAAIGAAVMTGSGRTAEARPQQAATETGKPKLGATLSPI